MRGFDANCCAMKGRRCAELASGDLDEFLNLMFDMEVATFLFRHCHGLTDQQKSDLMLDFEAGKQRMRVQLRIKTDAWGKLPLKIIAISHPDVAKARRAAAAVLAQYQLCTAAHRASMHDLTRELLAPGVGVTILSRHYHSQPFTCVRAIPSALLSALSVADHRPTTPPPPRSLCTFSRFHCPTDMAHVTLDAPPSHPPTTSTRNTCRSCPASRSCLFCLLPQVIFGTSSSRSFAVLRWTPCAICNGSPTRCSSSRTLKSASSDSTQWSVRESRSHTTTALHLCHLHYVVRS